MVYVGHVTRYWAATAIAICFLYWTFRAANRQGLPHTSLLSSDVDDNTATENSRPRTKMEDDQGQYLAKALQSTFNPPYSYPSRFPRIVWQTASEHGREKYAENAETWKKVQGFQYNFLTDDQADEFVHENFSDHQGLVEFWDNLNTPVLRADLLRYLLMLSAGGVYSDIDTSMLVHPDRWIPIDLGASTVNAIIGIEYDDNTYPMFVRPIGLCQWTLMSKPGHPIFDMAVQRVVSNLEYIARRKRVTLNELVLDKMEVLEATGPGMITDVVMHVLNEQRQNVTWETLHDQKEAKLYGDVLILPINGFAGSQKHSHAGNPAYGEKYVQHHFGRSWYAPERPGTDDERKEAAEKKEAANKLATDAKNPTPEQKDPPEHAKIDIKKDIKDTGT